METDIVDFAIPITVMIGVVVVLLGLYWLICAVADTNQWNEGHCLCGGNWVYEQAVGHKYTTEYLYHCDKCGKVITLSERR